METLDISDTLAARSDQLNADDLIGGPATVQITGVDKVSGDQPVAVHVTGYKPWKPCKTMRRLLVHAWGPDAAKWQGKWLTIYRDAEVVFGGSAVGGVRISHLSDIASAINVNLTSTKGKKSMHRVAVLVPPSSVMDLATFKQHLGAALKGGWTREQVATLIGAEKAENVNPDDRKPLAARLKEAPPAEEEVSFDEAGEE